MNPADNQTPAPAPTGTPASNAGSVPPVPPAPQDVQPVPPTPAPNQPPVGVPAAGMPTPVNPVITPRPANGAASFEQSFQQHQPLATPTMAATEAIMRPEPAPKPDPIEEELKAPLKAAEPVPGSIGSAVSVPAPEGTEELPPADNPFLWSGYPKQGSL